MTPGAIQGAPLEKHGGANPRPVVDRVFLNVENLPGLHELSGRRGVAERCYGFAGLLESVFRGKSYSFVEHGGKEMIAYGLFLGQSGRRNRDQG